MIQQDELADAIDRVAIVASRNAGEVDAKGVFPRQTIDALAQQGLLGLVSAENVGGSGAGLRQASAVIERLAGNCASTALVTMMHYCATAVVEAHGPADLRRKIAGGQSLGTLAFSETGSRSHFWAPLSTATADGKDVLLDASKSWVTSAGEADFYIWSSRPMSGEGASTMWLVGASQAGIEVAAGFNGLGMRGNSSKPMTAKSASVSREAMLGSDGGGFDLMMGIVLPWFQVLNASASVGIAEAAVSATAAHAGRTRFEHLGQSLADQPVIRHHIAKMRVQTDLALALLLDSLQAVETNRPDTMLRVLEVKAAASEAVVEVTDLAMRVCGGAAFRKELGVERNFRDARAATAMAPTTDALYDFIGKAVCGLPLF
ncbi:MAG TPA: acyl-CoA dehydrogenase family protein [Candidatus Acidoferrum sp.]|jgi:alkylation response protein AidB-like acyl-CoA dehydrogenase|nr:acyl-CoA dehydrogenase family protein [Candidatus Acidoferrum sp.]